MSEGDYEEAQLIEQGTKEVLIPAIRDMGQTLHDFPESVATGARRIATEVPQVDANAASDLNQAVNGAMPEAEGGAASVTANAETGVPATTTPATGSTGPVDDGFGTGSTGGQQPEGVGSCANGGTDPVDVVSGQMITAKVDAELPGVLPLVLRRAYASSYRHGQFFGPGWSSTLDQRLVIDDDGIHYLGDDAQVLNYSVPTQPGQQVLPASGARWPLAWNRVADAITVLDPATGQTRYFAPSPQAGPANARGRQVRHLVRVTDRNGNWLTITRDVDGVPVEVDHIGGYRIAVDSSYRGGGFRIDALRLIDPADPHGSGENLIGYGYDPAGRLVEILDGSNVPLVYEYDANQRITAWIARAGYRYEYAYDEAGRVVSAGGQDGKLAARLSFDVEARITTVTNSLGHSTEYHYDEHQHVCKTVDPLGAVTTAETDRYGRTTAFTDELGRTTRSAFNQHGHPVRVERLDGAAIEVEYDDRYNPIRVTRPGGGLWQYAYDERGNLTSITDATGAVTRYGYGEKGSLATVTDALGGVTVIETNRAGLPVAVTDPLGSTWRMTRNPRGQIVSLIDPLGAGTTTAYDGEGRPVLRTYPDGGTETWAYDACGNVVAYTDEAGGTTRFETGPFRLVTARIDPGGTRYAFTHDTELRLTQVTNPQQSSWLYIYDPAGNLVSEQDFNGRLLTYEYDAAGQMTRRINGAGQSVALTRDELGRVIRQLTGHGTEAQFEYDRSGGMIRATNQDSDVVFTRDVLGRVLTEASNGKALSNTFDAVGQRLTRTTPSGRVSTWKYDQAGHTIELMAGEQQISFGHDAVGHETYRWLGTDSALTSEWDALGRLTARRLLAVEGATDARTPRIVDERSWTYRADGYPDSVTDTREGTRRLDLDPTGRVRAVVAATWSEHYAYDSIGNLVHTADTRTPDAATTGQREVSGTLLRRAGRTRYEYDAQGRLIKTVRRTLSGGEKTWTFAYDPHDRLSDAVTPTGQRWHYLYDALGRRVAKQRVDADGEVVEETRFHWDGTVLAEQHQTSVQPGRDEITVTCWDYEPESWTPLAQERRSFFTHATQEVVDREFHAIITDLVGAPTELATPDGRIVWRRRTGLWGNALPTGADGLELDCPIGFPGQYHDAETGLDYNYHRYYDSAAARYTSADALGLAPAPNHHGYVDNPTIWLDPLGLAAQWNETFGNRKLAFNAARDHAGVPRSASPVRQWTVGGDPTRASSPNYVYRPYDPQANTATDPRAGWGNYYQYDTPNGSRVIAEHVADPLAPNPHFHAGMPPEGSPSDIDMTGKTYKQIMPKHHLYYPSEGDCGG